MNSLRSCFRWLPGLTAFLLMSAPCLSTAQVKEVRIADSKGDWGYPNPYRHYPRGPGYVRMSWVFDTLVWKDQKGYIPALAESWSFDPKKLCFHFKLNPKARWHDGRPLTAQDVVFTLGYYKKHPYSWITVDSVGRAVAEDSHTVTVHLSKPYSPFLSDIGGTMPVLSKHIWEGVGNPESFDDPKAYIGSGPYLFRDFNKPQGTSLYEAFDEYYLGRPKTERLIYVRSGKPLVSLVNGEVDLAGIQPDMAEPLRVQGPLQGKRDIHHREKLALADVRLSTEPEFLKRYPHELNMGAIQRVCIARAIVVTPSFLVADEPTSALDPSVQAKVLKMLLDLQVEKGLTMLFVTHDIGLARKIGDRIGVMLAGRLVEIGPLDRVMESPRHPYTKRLMECAAGRGEHIGFGLEPSVPEGCAFACRCSRATDICMKESPPAVAMDWGQHVTWCRFPNSCAS